MFAVVSLPGLGTALFQILALWPYPYTLPWQPVSYAFVHVGFVHLALNMFALWMFGRSIERLWGPKRFSIYYFVCIVGAALIQLLALWVEGRPAPTTGASGGTFGILLAFGMTFPNVKLIIFPVPFPVKAKWAVLGYGVLEVLLGVSGTFSVIAHFAHLGGMLFGWLLIQYWRARWPFRGR